MTRNEIRKQLILDGLCASCGQKPRRQDKATCEECGRKLAEAMKRWQAKKHAERKADGLCSCGGPVESGKTCEKCKERNNRNQRKRKTMGLCCYCSNQAKTGQTRCQQCSDKKREEAKQLKLEVFEAYGGAKCDCCSEGTECFLSIDHIDGNGNTHRREVGRTSLYRWLKANNFPSGYQVLCFNCNHGRYLNGGVCPHKQ
jgi:hypothetical protein